MRTLAWLLVAALGLGLMGYAYEESDRATPHTLFSDAIMFIGRGEPGPAAEDLEYTWVRVRLTPPSPLVAKVIKSLSTADDYGGILRILLSEKTIVFPGLADQLSSELLSYGRLPEPGAFEVLAGAEAPRRDEILVDDRPFKVVGVMKPAVAVLKDAYVIAVPPDWQPAPLGESADVLNGFLVFQPDQHESTPALRRQLAAAFPAHKFAAMIGQVRIAAWAFRVYLGGLGLMLVGGSALMIRLYGSLDRRLGGTWLGDPLRAIRRWRKLFVGLHVIVFGGVLVFFALAYQVPQAETAARGMIHEMIRSGSGPLGVAGSAYASGNILLAAGATFAVNFLWATVLTTFLPSAIVPGSGLVVMLLRVALVGLALAPSTVPAAGLMIPHSVTLLVEMEAYILATFFGLLIPIYVLRTQEGPTVLSRYGRALMLNLKGLIIVAAILAIAALYEATEVILQLRL